MSSRLARRAALAAALLASGCDDTTGLQRVSFRLRAGGALRDVAAPLSSTTSTGWRVTFEQARVVVGPFYFNIEAPINTGAARRPPRLRDRLAALAIPAAHAHEGADHFGGGRIVGQLLGRAALDLLSPELQDLGDGEAVSERALTASLSLLPEDPVTMAAALPDRAVATVRGVAERDGERLPFSASLRLDQKLSESQTLAQLRTVRGIPADLPFSAEGGTVVLRVDPRSWFDAADFSVLKAYAPQDGVYVARPDDSVGRSLLNGARLIRGVYAFTWLPAAAPAP